MSAIHRGAHEYAAAERFKKSGEPPSPAEVEALKADWAKDPCWDLSTTVGFSDYAEELAAYEAETRGRWQVEQAKREAEQDDERVRRDREYVKQRRDELGLAYGYPDSQAHNIATATVVIERALDRLTEQQKRIADMLAGIVEQGWAINVDSHNHY